MEQTPVRERKLAIMFPGQGSQHAGMGRKVAERSPGAREVFAQADEILKIKVSRIVMEGSERDLRKTTNTQPAILAVSWAYLVYLRERYESLGRHVRPTVVSGHSFGQFSAAASADALSFADALRLVRERGRIMTKWSQRRPGGMASVIGASEDTVRNVCESISPDGDVGVAAVNAPGQTVISGTLTALSRAMDAVRASGARVVQLPISVPGHFPKMAEARDELRRFIDGIEFHDPSVPVVSSLTGKLLTTADDVRQELSDQMTGAINWVRAFLAMRGAGVNAFMEAGPGNVLSNLSRRLDRDAQFVDVFDDAQFRDLVLGQPSIETVVGEAGAAHSPNS